MPLNALHRLPQTPFPAVPVIRERYQVLVEYDAASRLRILQVMDIPDMPGILRHDSHIIHILADDNETPRSRAAGYQPETRFARH